MIFNANRERPERVAGGGRAAGRNNTKRGRRNKITDVLRMWPEGTHQEKGAP